MQSTDVMLTHGTGNTIIEILKCPVCLEIPPAAIFQCSEGHIICEDCYRSNGMVSCVICRIPHGISTPDGYEARGNIRNRAIEDIMNNMRFSCPHQSNGCSTMIDRQELRMHKDFCRYRNTSDMCRQLNFECDFVTDKRDLEATATHLINSHDFEELAENIDRFSASFDFKDPITLKCSFLKLYDSTGVLTMFVILPALSMTRDNCQLFSLSIVEMSSTQRPTDSSKFNFHVKILSRNMRVNNLEQIIRPTPFFNCGLDVANPVVYFNAMALQLDYLHDGILRVEFEVRN